MNSYKVLDLLVRIFKKAGAKRVFGIMGDSLNAVERGGPGDLAVRPRLLRDARALMRLAKAPQFNSGNLQGEF